MTRSVIDEATIQRALAAEVVTERPDAVETLRAYLTRLVTTLWEEGEGFSGKRPLGDSGWQWVAYRGLINAGLITGTLDEDGYVDTLDTDQVHLADRIICVALTWCLRRET